jgi:hypothetical protein
MTAASQRARSYRVALALCLAAAALFLVALAGTPPAPVTAATGNPTNPHYLPIGDGKVTTTRLRLPLRRRAWRRRRGRRRALDPGRRDL